MSQSVSAAAPPPPSPIWCGNAAPERPAAPRTDSVAQAQAIAAGAAQHLAHAQAFQALPPATRARILDELGTITRQLGAAPLPLVAGLGTPLDFRTARRGDPAVTAPVAVADPAAQPGDVAAKTGKAPATETIARRAGALSDEIDFPDFVSGLVHNTFDAIVDASIRQMEAFANLVAAVAKTADEFTRDNVTPNHARDWLVAQYPNDLQLDLTDGPKVVPRVQPAQADGADEPAPPEWLAEYGLEGQPLTPDLIEQQIVPLARGRVGQGRQQMLATMVLLGMNRVIVKDGSISARLRFRAVAADHAKVDYAVSDDPGSGGDWGTRASSTYAQPTTKVSTVGVNVQTNSDLSAELFGEVKINFVSETLPLDRFVDDARRTLLERHARGKALPTPAAPAAALPTPTALPALAAPPSATAPSVAPHAG